jgi:hypothetical protein
MPQQRPELQYEAQARYQNAMGDVLDRMTKNIFGMASEMSQRAGLQFSAENPLTPQQLEAMSKGDMSQVKLGSPLNVFNSAVRKARAVEVSAHAEVEARTQMVELLQKAELGEINTDQVRDQIGAMMNGYGKSIAAIDPDASYKYRATMGAVGGRVLEKVAELDGKKRVLANTVKAQRAFTTLQQEVALAATTKMPIDQKTGKEIPVTAYIDALKQNFLTNATALLGPTAAAQYAERMDASINDSMVNAVMQHLINDPSFMGNPNAVSRLSRGDAGSASNAYQALTPQDQTKVRAAFISADAQRYTLQQRARSQGEANSRTENYRLYRQYLTATTPEDKARYGQLYANHPLTTPERLDKLYAPPKSSSYGEGVLENELYNNLITTENQLFQRAEELGVVDEGLKVAYKRFTSLYSKDGKFIRDKLKSAAKIPPGQFMLSSEKDSVFRQNYYKYEQEFFAAFEEAAQKGELASFDAYKVVTEIEKRALAAPQNAAAIAAQKTLDDVEAKTGLKVMPGETLEALERTLNNRPVGGFNKDDIPRIRSAVKNVYGGVK